MSVRLGYFSRQLNLEVVTSHPARILEWTGCVDYLEGWTLPSAQLQEAEGILTLAGLIEGLFISFVGTHASSHPALLCKIFCIRNHMLLLIWRNTH